MGDTIVNSPFLRHDILDRLLAPSNPSRPFWSRGLRNAVSSSSDSEELYGAGKDAFGLIYTHLASLDPARRKARSELLSAKIHLLVNPPIHGSSPVQHHLEKANPPGSPFAEVDEGVMLLRLRAECAILALVRAELGDGNSGSEDQTVQGQARLGSWRLAEQDASLVQSECQKLVKRFQIGKAGVKSRHSSDPSAERGGSVVRDGDMREDLEGGETVSLERTIEGGSSNGLYQRDDKPSAEREGDPEDEECDADEVNQRVRTYQEIQLVAVQVLIRVNQHFGRSTRVEGWKEKEIALRLKPDGRP